MKKPKNNPESNPLRVLILEDNPADAELTERELKRSGIVFSARQVEGKREFSKALAEFRPQVILSDFKLPRFAGLAALEITRLRAPDIPFIFVSGSIGEDKAIEMLAQGASDYILKENLARLGPAIKRVVEETCLKLEKKKSDEELRRHVDELRLLAEAADHFVQINDLDKLYNYLTQMVRDLSGADYLLLSLYDEKLQAVRPKIVTGFEPFRATIRRRFHIDPMQMVFYLKDMRQDDFSDFVSRRLVPVRDSLYGLANRKMPRSICRLIEKLMAIGSMYTMGFSWENQLFGGLTVFFKKDNELKNASQIEALANQAAVSIKRLLAEKSLGESEEKYRTLVETSPDAIIIVDAGGRTTFASPKTLEFFGIPAQTSIIGVSIMNFVEPGEIPIVQKRMVEILSGRSLPEIREYRLLRHDRQPFWGEISSSPLRDNAGQSIGLLLVCRDVSERKRTITALRESEEKYRLIAENTADTITVLDLDLKFTFVSPSIFKLHGYTVEETRSLTLQQSLTPNSFAKIQEVFSEEMALEASGSADPKRSRTLELQEYNKDGSIIWVENSLSYIRDAQGKAIGILAVSKDISERKQAEAELRREKAFLEKLVEAAPEGIAITDCPGRVLQVNSEFVKMFGYEADEAIGKSIDDLLVPPEYVEEAGSITRSVGAGKTNAIETMRKRKDGTVFAVSIIGAPIHIAKQQVAVYAIYRDISERKHAEEKIQASLREKEVLLQEIHHRVKNNLQIISGLLTLQADQAGGKPLDEIFQESQDRIRSIALIHEKLYRSHNLAEIAFDEYLRSLAENLFTSQGIAAGRITLKYEMEPILFTIEKAIPLGLIVNELVTNSLKHAFPNGRQGEIRIELHGYEGAKSYTQKTDSGTLHRVPTCELIVADNGVGLPSGQVPGQQKTLGMNLVSMLARQLQAELKVKTGPGAEFRLLFPGLPANQAVKDNGHGD